MYLWICAFFISHMRFGKIEENVKKKKMTNDLTLCSRIIKHRRKHLKSTNVFNVIKKSRMNECGGAGWCCMYYVWVDDILCEFIIFLKWYPFKFVISNFIFHSFLVILFLVCKNDFMILTMNDKHANA